MDTFFPFVGGIGLFLIGMMLLSDGLVAFAGSALRRGLVRFTGTPFKAFASGALITALVQSSTATTVTLIGFVSAGLITFSQAVGVVIGASLGSTATGWLVAGLGLQIKLGYYIMPLIGLGALIKLLAHGRWAGIGLALAGFGLLFLGLDMLQDGMRGLAGVFNLAQLPVGGFWAHIAVMLIGLALTALLQSSAAAIATTLTALHTGTINFDQAAAVVVGAAIGTTLTSAMVAIGATVAAKRTALAHILFNLIAGLIAIALLPALLAVIGFLDRYFNTTAGPLSLTAFHTLFILVGVAIFLPQTPRFAQLVERLIPERNDSLVRHLDNSLLSVPAVALEASQRALEKISLRQFDLYSRILNQPSVFPPPNESRILHDALERTFDFVTRTQVPSDDNPLSGQRVALLHAIDHLLRMTGRLQELQQAPIEFGNARYRDALVHSKAMLAMAGAGNGAIPDNLDLDLLEHEAKALRALTHQMRRDILLEAAGDSDTSQALHIMDAFRWMERTAHHVLRICHYLKTGRALSEQFSNANTSKSEDLPNEPDED